MQPRRVELMPSFDEAFDDMPGDIQQKTVEALEHFADRSADNALRPELKNGFDNVWSIRVSKGYRAFYKKLRDSEGAIFCMFHVGHHDDYRILNSLASRVSISINTLAKNVQISVNASAHLSGKKTGQPAKKTIRRAKSA